MADRRRCPYCDKPMSAPKLRLHVASNVCGQVPTDVALAYKPDEAKATSEAAYLREITQYATETGWRWFHIERGRGRDGHWLTATTGAPGVPDLWLVRPPFMVVLELKRQRGGKDQPGQADWCNVIDELPFATAWMGVRPSDWPAVQMLLRDGQPG